MIRHRAAGDWNFPAELAPLNEAEQEDNSADQEWPDARRTNAHYQYRL